MQMIPAFENRPVSYVRSEHTQGHLKENRNQLNATPLKNINREIANGTHW